MLLLSDSPSQARTPIALRIAAFVAIAIALVAGVLLLGRLAPDDRAAMALTAVWFGLVGVAALLLLRRRRDLLVPLGAGFASVAVAVGVVLGLPMFIDKEVNEQVAVGTPQSQVESRVPAGARDRSQRADGEPAQTARAADNVEVAAGSFEGVRHDGSGNAAVVKLAGGGQVLTLTDSETDNGPDLFVYLAAGRPTDEDGVNDFVNLGKLKGNIGNQQYEIPDGTDVGRYSTVVIWCRAFSVLFTRAELRPS